MTLACAGGLLVLALGPLVALGLLGEARGRSVARALSRAGSRAMLAVLGVRVVVRGELPTEPVVYVANHTSSLDVLLVLALGLPRTRSFLSEWAGRAWPLRALGDRLGVFWTVPQGHQAERRRRFAAASRALRASGESVFLSPEGVRVRTGIGPFNRGAFHLALDLGRSIVPLHVTIPSSCDPDAGGWIGPGCVEVVILAPASTQSWSLESLDLHAAEVRGRLLELHAARALSRACSD